MSRFKAVLVAMSVVVLMASAAHAATVGGEVFGALNTYSMGDVNDAIQVDNSLGANFDELSNSVGGGLGVRVWPSAIWMVEACWEPLFLETQSSPTSSTWNMDANSFQVSAYRFFPNQNPNTRFGVGGGVGMYSVSGENVDPAQSPATLAIEGSGPGFHVMGLGEWTLSQGFNLTAGAGYRFASIEIDGSNNNATADYSGFMGRVGLAFYLPQSK